MREVHYPFNLVANEVYAPLSRALSDLAVREKLSPLPGRGPARAVPRMRRSPPQVSEDQTIRMKRGYSIILHALQSNACRVPERRITEI